MKTLKVVTPFCSFEATNFKVAGGKVNPLILDATARWLEGKQVPAILEEHPIQDQDIALFLAHHRVRVVWARAYYALRACKVNTVGDLCQLTERDILRQRNCGRVTLAYITKALKRHKLTLKNSPEAP